MAGHDSEYTDKAMHNHVKTYNGFLTLLKVGIGITIFALIILIIVYKI